MPKAIALHCSIRTVERPSKNYVLEHEPLSSEVIRQMIATELIRKMAGLEALPPQTELVEDDGVECLNQFLDMCWTSSPTH